MKLLLVYIGKQGNAKLLPRMSERIEQTILCQTFPEKPVGMLLAADLLFRHERKEAQSPR